MTKGEINLLYGEVEKLLNDICMFLSEDINNENIPHTRRSLANTLIERSKQQLQEISKATVADTSDCNNEPYVDMQGCKANQENEEPQEVYSDVSLTFETPPSIVTVVEEECLVCPYANLPANEIKDGKRGNLHRKEKILFFEQQKKVYGAVQNSWLLIYMNENSLKPCQTFDLTRYEAKPASVQLKDAKRRDETFELMSIIDPKLYCFTALTAKDMVQWVAAINKPTENTTVKRSLPPLPPNNDLQEVASQTSMEYNDYEPLTEYQINHQNTNANKKMDSVNKDEKPVESAPLPLPPRNTPQKNKLAQNIPTRLPSDESLENYDFVGVAVQHSSQDNSSSFSEDDSDTVYDNPSEIRNRKPPFNVNSKIEDSVHLQYEEDEIYDSLQKPVPPPINSKPASWKNINPSNDLQYEEDEIYDSLQKPAPSPVNTTLVDSKNIKTFDDKKRNEDEVKTKVKPTLKPKILSLKYRRKKNT